MVVAGATGTVGSGVVRSFLDAGATVVGISRSAEKLDLLKKALAIRPADPFLGVDGEFYSEPAAEATKALVLRSLGGRSIDHVISTIGFVHAAPPATETPLATVHKALEDGLYNTFLCAKVFLPLIKATPGASFTMTSGGLAHFAPPNPSLWLGTLKNAAVNALTFGLASETANSEVRVNTACIHFSVGALGSKQNQLGMPATNDTLKLGPGFVALAKGTTRGKVICLHDWKDVAQMGNAAE